MSNNPNSSIARASRGLVANWEAQKEKGGSDYRYWEDDLAPALEEFAEAIVQETVARLEKLLIPPKRSSVDRDKIGVETSRKL